MNDIAIKEDSIALSQNLLPDDIDERILPIDVLNRQEIVEQILDLLITLSDAQSSCAFALNGKWGSGKTFLLNMLEPKLRDYQAGEKFMVFHYILHIENICSDLGRSQPTSASNGKGIFAG